MTYPHDPDCETQRAGFCVYHSGRGEWFTGKGTYPWTKSAKDAHVYTLEVYARSAAKMFGAEVTTVPRFNGHYRVWEVLPEAEQAETTTTYGGWP